MTRTRTWLAAYGIALGVFAAIDVVWISLVAMSVYRAQLGDLLADGFNLVAAILFYFGWVAGLVQFGVRPLEDGPTLARRVGAAALYGLFTYGTWALTGLAVLEGFTAFVAVTDIAWGVGVSALVTLVTVSLSRRFGRAR